MGMDTHTVYGGRHPVCHSDVCGNHHVRTLRTEQCANSPLHILALFALGYQTFLESDC